MKWESVGRREPLEGGLLGKPQDRDLVGVATAAALGCLKGINQLGEFFLAAPAEIDEGDANPPVVGNAVANGSKCAERSGVGGDADIDEGVDIEFGQAGDHQKAAAGADIDDAAGHGDVGIQRPGGCLAKQPVTPRAPMLRRSSIAGHFDFNSHGSVPL